MIFCGQCGQKHAPNLTCPGTKNSAYPAINSTQQEKVSEKTSPPYIPVQTLKDKEKLASHDQISAGMKIAGYTLEKFLGQGGMGEVWKARQEAIHKEVAIKILDRKFSMDGAMVTRLLREAQAVNEIHHKNFVDIFGFGEIEGTRRPYLVMEYLEGKSLTLSLQEKTRFTPQEILPIFQQLCLAMQAAHDQEIVHRDLKPDNIFLLTENSSDTPFVKILDFGIAKLRSSKEQNLTQTGEIFGTPQYMSPEQCKGAKNVDARSDIYSLGIILYEMICGRTPFGETREQKQGSIWIKHLTATPPPLSHFTKVPLPEGLENVLKTCLQKEPEQRFQHSTELLNAFENTLSTSKTPQETKSTIFEAEEKTILSDLSTLDIKPTSQNHTFRTAFVTSILGGALFFFVYWYFFLKIPTEQMATIIPQSSLVSEKTAKNNSASQASKVPSPNSVPTTKPSPASKAVKIQDVPKDEKNIASKKPTISKKPAIKSTPNKAKKPPKETPKNVSTEKPEDIKGGTLDPWEDESGKKKP